MNYELIPEHCRESVRTCIEERHPIGGFLTAVFSNDLVLAHGTADSINLAALHNYCDFLYNEALSPCWGSKDKVLAWLKGATK